MNVCDFINEKTKRGVWLLSASTARYVSLNVQPMPESAKWDGVEGKIQSLEK